ncbi:AEC family transporter [Acinetobacter sp. ASP199]|uniref:AEC family transporter n=1 Tax=unclassified Acinetobacter TaxID=196816 RepID=UPI001F61CC9D|nr:AEC family transporter [Acinetobacter sp. ASP199]UNT58022.1 AEC family transporter [Acinetobacter sp. ASP199]
MLHTIFSVLFPLITLITLGYGLKQKKWLEDGFWRGAEKLNYYVLFPIMLFLNLATAQIKIDIIQDVVLVISIITVLVCAVLYSLKAIYQINFARFGVYVQSILRFNTYIGIAAVSALFGQAGMTVFAVIMVFFIPTVNIISVLAFTRPADMQFGKIFISLAKNPLILGCLLGGLYNLSGLVIWQGMNQLLKQMAACSLPLGLMCVGAALKFGQINLDLWRIVWNTSGRMILMPLLGLGVCKMLGISTLTTQVLVLFFALPTASASYVLTKVLGGDSELMAKVISVQTVVAGLTLPLLLTFII